MINSNAIFSEDRKYRYVLIREWDLNKPVLMIICLNPSTADEKINDPTIRRCIGFAKKWGFGKLFVTNLFSFRATKPRDLFNYDHPIGDKNDYWLKKLSGEVDKVVLAYGNHGNFKNRHSEILKIINNPYCIKKSKIGMPTHILYISNTQKSLLVIQNSLCYWFLICRPTSFLFYPGFSTYLFLWSAKGCKSPLLIAPHFLREILSLSQ